MKGQKENPSGYPPPSTPNPARRAFPWLVVLAAALVFAGPPVKKLVAEFKWSGLPRQVSSLDKNANGINDTDDIIEGARLEAARQPTYKSAYYVGGYPPETEGACTDVIWRAFQHAGYDLKALIDADIKAHTSAYPRTQGKPDRHIDFRRVPNQRIFFQRHGLSLTKELIPGDQDNLVQWQPGDIVTFKDPDHVAILSTKRNADGLPYLIHNDGPWASEDDDFPFWAGRGITGHFRFPKGEYVDPPTSKPSRNTGPILNLSTEITRQGKAPTRGSE